MSGPQSPSTIVDGLGNAPVGIKASFGRPGCLLQPGERREQTKQIAYSQAIAVMAGLVLKNIQSEVKDA